MIRAVLALIMWTAEESLSGMSRHPASKCLISSAGISGEILVRPP